MRKTSPSATALLVALILLVSNSCATAPKAAVTSGIRFANIATLKALYGYKFDANPYLEPTTLLRGKLNEFVVLEVDVNLAAAAHVSVSAELRDASGKLLQREMSRDAFNFYWSQRPDGPQDTTRESNISRSYLPSGDFLGKTGFTKSYLVIVGPNPIPRPATVHAELTIEGQETIVFDSELAPPAK